MMNAKFLFIIICVLINITNNVACQASEETTPKSKSEVTPKNILFRVSTFQNTMKQSWRQEAPQLTIFGNCELNRTFSIDKNKNEVVVEFHSEKEAAKVTIEKKDQPTGKAWLGIATSQVSAELKEHLNLKDDGGILVDFVHPEGAAHNKLFQLDVLMQIDDTKIFTRNDLRQKLSTQKPGDKVKIKLYRKGVIVMQEITLCLAPQKPNRGEVTNLPYIESLDIIAERMAIDLQNSVLHESLKKISSDIDNERQGDNSSVSIVVVRRFSEFILVLKVDTVAGWRLEVQEIKERKKSFIYNSSSMIDVNNIPQEYRQEYDILLEILSKNNLYKKHFENKK